MLVLLKKLFLKKRKPTLRERIEKYTEAITFAEAGLDEKAKELVKKKKEKARIVVVGNEYSFSEEVQEYALGFADRLGYDIIALNIGPIEKVSSLEPHCDLLCEQFKNKCSESIGIFRKRCKNRKIGFTHTIKFGKVDNCISEVDREFDGIEFVITEPKKKIGDSYIIPVFSVAHVK